MGFLTKRMVTEVTFMDSLSTNEEMSNVTLRLRSVGSGRFLELANSLKNSTIYLYHPDDLRRLWETAVQMWEQGAIVPGDSEAAAPEFEDASAAIKPLTPNPNEHHDLLRNRRRTTAGAAG